MPPPLPLPLAAPAEAAAFAACTALQRALCSVQCAFWQSTLRGRRIQPFKNRAGLRWATIKCFLAQLGPPQLQNCASLHAPHTRGCSAPSPHPLHVSLFMREAGSLRLPLNSWIAACNSCRWAGVCGRQRSPCCRRCCRLGALGAATTLASARAAVHCFGTPAPAIWKLCFALENFHATWGVS